MTKHVSHGSQKDLKILEEKLTVTEHKHMILNDFDTSKWLNHGCFLFFFRGVRSCHCTSSVAHWSTYAGFHKWGHLKMDGL